MRKHKFQKKLLIIFNLLFLSVFILETQVYAMGLQERENYNKCSVYFNAPTNYQSYSINSSHSVTASGETWSTNLSLAN